MDLFHKTAIYRSIPYFYYARDKVSFIVKVAGKHAL